MQNKIIIFLSLVLILLFVFIYFYEGGRNKKKEKVIFLEQKDFENGPYVITSPGTYKLKEDIICNPNSEYDHRPRPYQLNSEDPHKGPHSLGFHTCISVQSKNVKIDLNKYKLCMSREFYLQQRFCSLIETTNQPFNPEEGPSNFGDNIINDIDVEVCNGILGLTSHHCIHGNNNSTIKINNVIFEDYEIAAISFNNPEHVYIEDCEFKGNFHNVPVMSRYSTSRNIINFAKKLYEETYNCELLEKINNLQKLMDKTLEQWVRCGKVYEPLFKNTSHIPDGGPYHILIHPKGVSVNDFTTNPKDKDYIDTVEIRNCKLRDLKTEIHEIVCLGKNSDGHKDTSESEDSGVDTIIKTVDGSLFQILNFIDEEYKYKSNPLSDLELCIARIDPSLGTNNIDQNIIDWADNNEDLSYLIEKGYKFIIHSDSMFHVIKGLNCLRFDCVENLVLDNVKVVNFKNYSQPCLEDYLLNMFDKLDINYDKIGINSSSVKDLIVIHINQFLVDDYLGTRSCGLVMVGVKNIDFNNVNIVNGFSKYGKSYGVVSINCSQDIKCKVLDYISNGKLLIKCVDEKYMDLYVKNTNKKFIDAYRN